VRSWLESLPHQIPFRAASSGRILDEQTIEGEMLVTSNDALSNGGALPFAMIFEAMAQLGGGLAFRGSGTHGYFSAIDCASMEHLPEAGDRLRLTVRMEAAFGRIYRFEGSAQREGLEIARARFYLAAPEESVD
jgi:3-hydroxymyristoyl/3-hydroxydecanoyl-(acyl carrier protein) dehydratase